MPKIAVSRDHQLSMDAAREKVEVLCRDLEAKYGFTNAGWSGNQLEMKRTGAKGKISLQEGRIIVEVDLSLVLAAAKGRVEAKLKEKLEEEFG